MSGPYDIRKATAILAKAAWNIERGLAGDALTEAVRKRFRIERTAGETDDQLRRRADETPDPCTMVNSDGGVS